MSAEVASRIQIRRAADLDLPRLTAIYNTYIIDASVSFDTEPWTLERRQRWFDDKRPHPLHQVWVALDEGHVIGAAWSGRWRDKEAYKWSVETTVVLDPARTGQGIGHALYGALIDALDAAGAHRLYAIVTLPNPGSIALHRKLGFTTIGVLDEAGFKLGRWWSTELLERPTPRHPVRPVGSSGS